MPSTSWKLSCVSSAFDPDIRAAAKSARRAGFEGLQIDAISSPLDLTTMSASGRRELRHVLSGQNLDLVSLRTDLGNKGFAPTADIDAALARVRSILAAAVGLLCPLVCIEIGPLPAPPPGPKPSSTISPQLAGLIIIPPIARPAPDIMREDHIPAQLDPTFSASVDGALAEVGQIADRHGVTLAFRTELAGYSALDRALRTAACPWFGVDLDPAAILRDQWPEDEIFSHFAGSIRHLRGKDALGGADHRTKPAIVGQGSTHWPQLLATLDSAGYRGWITIDALELPDRATATLQGAAFLREILPTG